jgi:hypothetical protein
MQDLSLKFQTLNQAKNLASFPEASFSNSHDSHVPTPLPNFQTLFISNPVQLNPCSPPTRFLPTLTCAALRSLNVCFSWGATCVGPGIEIVVTISGSSVGIFTARNRGYSWNRNITIRGHSVTTLKERTLGLSCPRWGPRGLEGGAWLEASGGGGSWKK